MDVEQYCWGRGYIYLLHYGGSTAACQVNDTHCHLYVSETYVELEQRFFTEVQSNDPGNIDRSFPQVVADVVKMWRMLDHAVSCDGHWATGLANKLEGKEDHYGRGPGDLGLEHHVGGTH